MARTLKLLELAKLQAYGLARDADFEGLRMDDILSIKADPDLVRYTPVSDAIVLDIAEDFDGESRAADSKDGRTIPYVMSTESAVGWSGDVIPVTAWDLDEFKRRSQPFLYAHNIAQDLPPLGNMNGVKRGKTKAGAKALIGNGQFSAEGLSGFNDLIFELVDAGVMTNGSVGFRVRDARLPKNEKEQEKLGMGPYGVIFTDAVLMEFSAVPVGMDPDAVTTRTAELDSLEARLVQLVEDGKFDADLVQEFRARCHGLSPVLRTSVPVIGMPDCRYDEANDLTLSDGPTLRDCANRASADVGTGGEVVSNEDGTFTFSGDNSGDGHDSKEIEALRSEVTELSATIDELRNDITNLSAATAHNARRMDAQVKADAARVRAPEPDPKPDKDTDGDVEFDFDFAANTEDETVFDIS